MFSGGCEFIAKVGGATKRLLQDPFRAVSMIKLSRPAIRLLFAVLFLCGFAWGGRDSDRKPVLMHADAAVILAKYSGYFDRYVEEDADLNECVAFLNRTGIYFGLLEVVNGSEYTVRDCARSMGQIDLVLSGDAEFSMGKVKLPKGVDSWDDFCTMSGVEYVEGHQTMLKILTMADTRRG